MALTIGTRQPPHRGPYTHVRVVPASLERVQRTVDSVGNADPGYEDAGEAADSSVSRIIVRTQPTELIQSDGDPRVCADTGYGSGYVVNSHDDIFRVIGSGQYYVLLSGRWYRSDHLEGSWQYVSSDALPAGFAKIPEGSPKDKVLASVAGTPAAREAVLDAQIPQTARVDRKNAQVNVAYDGAPQFEDVPGTHLQYAVNSPMPVIGYRGRYYAVDKGVWFEAAGPTGPWQVCTERPEEVDLIPPTCPVYPVKYVYIYDVTPDWVYVGYTPGYLNTFVFGPTVVYGTGFLLPSVAGACLLSPAMDLGFQYVVRPLGRLDFRVRLRPGLVHVDVVWGGGFWFGGWWGPMVYRPPYIAWNLARRGFYGRDSYRVRERLFRYGNNIYRTGRASWIGSLPNG